MPADDPSKAVIARLEAGNEIVAVGQFSLDVQAAQAKLETYRLADPEAFVLLLVEAAHMFAGCTGIEFEITRRSTRVILRHVELDEVELRGVIDAASASADGLNVEATARLRGQQLLGLALVTIGRLEHAGVVLGSSAASSQLELPRGAAIRFTTQGGARRFDGSTWLTIREHRWAGMRLSTVAALSEQRRQLLRVRARYARVPVWLDGRQVSEGFALSESAQSHVVRGADRRVLGVLGQSRVRPQPTLLLVANGVLIEKLFDAELPAHTVALVEASDLPRDLSTTRLLRQRAYTQRIAEIRKAAASLAPTTWVSAIYAESTGSSVGLFACILAVTGLAFVLLGVSGAIAALSSGEWALALVGGATSAFGLVQFQPIRNGLRRGWVRDSGQPGMITIESSTLVTKGLLTRTERLQGLVHVPGQASYHAEIQGTMKRNAAHLLRDDMVHVRVDPRDPKRVCLASSPPLGLNEGA